MNHTQTKYGDSIDVNVPRHTPSVIEGLTMATALSELSDILSGNYTADQIELTNTGLKCNPKQTGNRKNAKTVLFSALFGEHQVYFTSLIPAQNNPNHYMVGVMSADSIRNAPINGPPKQIVAFLTAEIHVDGDGQQETLSRARRAVDILFTAYNDRLLQDPHKDSVTLTPNPARSPQDAQHTATTSDDLPTANKLETLKTLKDKGLLSDQEYEERRRKMLDQL